MTPDARLLESDMSKTIFDSRRHSGKRLLTTDDPTLSDLKEIPPISGLPEGRARVKLRPEYALARVYVKTPEGIRAFAIQVEEDGSWARGPELEANWNVNNEK